MTPEIDTHWQQRLSKIDYAFQPIVNIHTGNAFGFEALLRGHDQAGFDSIGEVFDQAYSEGILHPVDLFLREKAFSKFSAFKGRNRVKLFYNLDNRLFDTHGYTPGSTARMLEKNGYALDDICFEISEKHQFQCNREAGRILDIYRNQGYKIALDDCGTGFSGLQLLYFTEPDYIKIDRFFIQNLENDPKKRLVVSAIVNLAHFMGSLVLAEGVETMDEYMRCKAIGCDMVQGYFIQKPQQDIEKLQQCYSLVSDLTARDKRNAGSKNRALIERQMTYIKPVYSDTAIVALFDQFKEGQRFFPVINRYDEPMGVIRDSAFKEYIFSKFGRQLIENPSFGKDISRFVKKIPMADIHSSIEQLIETYTQFSNNEGLIMVSDMKYVGILSTNALLNIINEKNLTQARNQNPLTKLPGNTMIHEYFSKSLLDVTQTIHIIYFDFDHFKPFNDRYGFRNGDRLILMFSEMLKKAALSDNRFVGHVGGDDFFMGICGARTRSVIREIQAITAQFKKDAESFYDPDTLKQGFLDVTDRQGRPGRLPLITVSAAVLELPGGADRACSIEEAGNIIARLKKKAKQSDTGLSHASILTFLSRETESGMPATA